MERELDVRVMEEIEGSKVIIVFHHLPYKVVQRHRRSPAAAWFNTETAREQKIKCQRIIKNQKVRIMGAGSQERAQKGILAK